MTAKPVPEHISDERLAEIIKGCEGVTPGPWSAVDWVDRSTIGSDAKDVILATVHDFQRAHGFLPRAANAAHVARLDPQTVAALLTELQHRREAEAVAWRWRYDDPAAPGKKLGWFFGPIEPPPNALGRSWSGWECEPLYAASPSSPASGVRVIEELERQTENLSFILNRVGEDVLHQWHGKFDRELREAQALLSALGEHP